MKDALQYLLDTYRPFFEVNDVDRKVLAVGKEVSLLDLEQFQNSPYRIRSTVALASSDSFCEYVNRFKREQSSIYIDVATGEFKAVLDHHGPGEPHWCNHVAMFAPAQSREWAAWHKAHDEWQSQIDFAEMIEFLLDTVYQPEPANVLKAALEFQANEALVVASTQNLDDGTVKFTFSKDTASKAVTFPHRITLCLSVFENEKSDLFEARIRYRVSNEGVLRFKFSFVKNPGIIRRDALLELAEKTKNATEGLAHYEGQFKTWSKPQL